jgi:hypothetical protein
MVDMRMVHEVLAPGVKDADEPDLRSQVFRDFRYFRQGFRNGLEQNAVEGLRRSGMVKTTWKYGMGSRSFSREA